VKGLFFPSGPFFLIDLSSFFAACVVFFFFFFLVWKKEASVCILLELYTTIVLQSPGPGLVLKDVQNVSIDFYTFQTVSKCNRIQGV